MYRTRRLGRSISKSRTVIKKWFGSRIERLADVQDMRIKLCTINGFWIRQAVSSFFHSVFTFCDKQFVDIKKVILNDTCLSCSPHASCAPHLSTSLLSQRHSQTTSKHSHLLRWSPRSILRTERFESRSACHFTPIDALRGPSNSHRLDPDVPPRQRSLLRPACHRVHTASSGTEYSQPHSQFRYLSHSLIP